MKSKNNIILVTCSEEKLKTSSAAKNLYTSERFKLCRDLAEKESREWFILSAKHGLIKPDKKISNYDLELKNLTENERKKWGNRAAEIIKENLRSGENLICLGDPFYFEESLKSLDGKKNNIFVPFKHLSENRWVPWLRQYVHGERLKYVNEFYKLFEKLIVNGRRFGDCKGGMQWPKKGLYLFFSDSEKRMFAQESDRVVRVGTHAVSIGSKSSLWQRLKAHKGELDGRGNHRSSIFRLHVGSAIIKRDGIKCESWGEGQNANSKTKKDEEEIEKMVSGYLADLNLACLEILDEPSKTSDRAYLEQNMIGLLTGGSGPVEFAPEHWLGYYCANKAVANSSLWNVNYTDFHFDPRFIEVLGTYISSTLKKTKPPKNSIAPKNWFVESKGGFRQQALDLN